MTTFVSPAGLGIGDRIVMRAPSGGVTRLTLSGMPEQDRNGSWHIPCGPVTLVVPEHATVRLTVPEMTCGTAIYGGLA